MLALLSATLSLAVLAAQPASPARVDTVRATVSALITEDSPRTPFLFGRVTGIAIDAKQHVYVSDGGEFRVAVFTMDGQPITNIGRKGKGPGEFEYPTGPVVGDDNALYVRNMSRVSRFVLDARTGVLGRFDRAFDGPSMAPWMSMLPTVIDRKGRLHFPLEWGSQKDGLTHNSFQQFTSTGAPLDSLPVPTQSTARSNWASVQVSPGTGRIIKGINVVPFHPQPVFTVSANGTIIASPADRYLLTETDAKGRVVRTLSRDVVPPAIPAAERADSARALTRRLDSLTVPMSQVNGMSEEVKSRRLPTTYPVFRSLSTATDGTIWARRWSAATQRGTSWFDVLSEDGSLLRTVIVPADCTTMPVPVIRDGVLACVQLAPETDAESVVIARVPVRR